MTETEARKALADWAQRRRDVDEDRAPLIREAVAAGVNKHQIHVLTGLARTTIDDILNTNGGTQ